MEKTIASAEGSATLVGENGLKTLNKCFISF